MYLWNTLQVSGRCDDFYWRFDGLKKIIFIGDVYVAVALRGLKTKANSYFITRKRKKGFIIFPSHKIIVQKYPVLSETCNPQGGPRGRCETQLGPPNCIVLTVSIPPPPHGDTLVIHWFSPHHHYLRHQQLHLLILVNLRKSKLNLFRLSQCLFSD